jgi:MFS family permease
MKYGFVFGIVSLAALIFAPLCSLYGEFIGPKLVYNVSTLAVGLVSTLFGALIYVDDVGWFITLSYALRFIEGGASAAANAAVVAILMQLFPERAASVTAFTEMFMGLGYMIGKLFLSINSLKN